MKSIFKRLLSAALILAMIMSFAPAALAEDAAAGPEDMIREAFTDPGLFISDDITFSGDTYSVPYYRSDGKTVLQIMPINGLDKIKDKYAYGIKVLQEEREAQNAHQTANYKLYGKTSKEKVEGQRMSRLKADFIGTPSDVKNLVLRNDTESRRTGFTSEVEVSLYDKETSQGSIDRGSAIPLATHKYTLNMLPEPEKCIVTFVVTDENGNAAEGAKLTVKDPSGSVVKPQADGSYDLIPGNKYAITASAISHFTDTVEYTADKSETKNIALKKDEIADGTYTIDATADHSMFKPVKAIVIAKDNKLTAYITLSGTGFDRMYQGTPQAAMADEKSGNEDALIGYTKSEEDSGYTFWPFPIRQIDEKINIAARSHKHFHKQDTDDYWYAHDITFMRNTLVKLNDSTEYTPYGQNIEQAEASKVIWQYFMDCGIAAVNGNSIRNSVKTKEKFTVPYYDRESNVIADIQLKSTDKFAYGWFIDPSKYGSGKGFFTKDAEELLRSPAFLSAPLSFDKGRTEGFTFEATLKLFAKGTDAADINGGKAEVLAEQTFTIAVDPKPALTDVVVNVKDKNTGKPVKDPVINITDPQGGKVEPIKAYTYRLDSALTYDITVNAKGYMLNAEQESFTDKIVRPVKPGFDVELIREEDLFSAIRFDIRDQFGEKVIAPVLTVTKGGSQVKPDNDGSYKLANGLEYNYSVSAEGYDDVADTSFTPSKPETVKVIQKKHLDEYKLTVKPEDWEGFATPIEEGVTVTLTYKDGEETKEVKPESDGTYIIKKNVEYTAHASKEGYRDGSATITACDSIEAKELRVGMLRTEKQKLKEAVEAAKNKLAEIKDGDKPGEYEAGAHDKLSDAINAAEAVLNDNASTSEQFEDAKRELQKVQKQVRNMRHADVAAISMYIYDGYEAPPRYVETLNVTGDDAVTYRYDKGNSKFKEVTPADALTALHIQDYKEEYTPENASEFLELDGWGDLLLKKIFKKKVTGGSSLFVNGEAREFISCAKISLNEGDVVSIVINNKNYKFYVLDFEKPEISINEGDSAVFKLSAHRSTVYGLPLIEDLSGFSFTFTDKNGKTLEATSDKSGNVKISDLKEGEYVLTGMKAPDSENNYYMPYGKVTVGAAPAKLPEFDTAENNASIEKNREDGVEAEDGMLRYTKGVSKGLTFHILNAEPEDLEEVSLDGKVISKDDYTVENGSIMIGFEKQLIDSLSAGEHELGIKLKEGEVKTKFLVAEATPDAETIEPENKSGAPAQKPAEPTKPETPENPTKAVNTGDGRSPAYPAAAIILSGLGMVIVSAEKKRRSR